MAVKKRSGTKVILTLSSHIIKKIDKELKRLRKEASENKPTRASICLSIIEEGLAKIDLTNAEKDLAYQQILDQSKELEKQAKLCTDVGEDEKASSLYLLAAAKELEALAVLGTKNESMIKTTLIQTIHLIKRGTGYSHLPNVPVNKDHVNRVH